MSIYALRLRAAVMLAQLGAALIRVGQQIPRA